MFISFEQENVAIVEFGAKTQVLHSLSTDYPSIRRKIGKCSEFMFVSVNILGNVLDSFPSLRCSNCETPAVFLVAATNAKNLDKLT